MSDNPFIIEMENIHKIYEENNVYANKGVNLQVRNQEIHAIVGENGAGKTTLMKILCGLEHPDKGQIKYKGEAVSIKSTHDADRLGIGMVHQHFCLFDEFSVADNVVLAKEPIRNGFFYDREKAVSAVKEYEEKYGLTIDPNELIRNLSVGAKQKVEILRILYRGSKLLVLDEPTALLTEQEIHAFFGTLRQLRKLGYTIIIITHKLDEVLEISERVTVMRNGEVVDHCVTEDCDTRSLAKMMVGKEVLLKVDKPEVERGETILQIENLSLIDPHLPRPVLNDVNLQLKAGEIFGIAGVAGNGLDDLENVLTGMNTRGKAEGRIVLLNKDIVNLHPSKIRDLGMAYVPADRLQRGTSIDLQLSENLIIVDHHDLVKFEIFQKSKVFKFVKGLISKFNIKGHPNIQVKNLSGGNIQRVVLSREFSRDSKMLVISEPTWGLDIISSEFVYKKIMEMRSKGAAILLISSNLDEILALSDKIGVMFKGKVVGVFQNENLDREYIGEYMLGINRQSEEEIKEMLEV
jgi:general nucleoside transport system ATP-binding protein